MIKWLRSRQRPPTPSLGMKVKIWMKIYLSRRVSLWMRRTMSWSWGDEEDSSQDSSDESY
ncbi:hypothetical protein HKD37_14G039469 [Glycine soja]